MLQARLIFGISSKPEPVLLALKRGCLLDFTGSWPWRFSGNQDSHSFLREPLNGPLPAMARGCGVLGSPQE